MIREIIYSTTLLLSLRGLVQRWQGREACSLGFRLSYCMHALVSAENDLSDSFKIEEWI